MVCFPITFGFRAASMTMIRSGGATIPLSTAE
jgi:hypothetical protein